MRSVYAELCVRLLQSEIMLEQGMVPDISTYRSVFCPEGGDAPWMLDGPVKIYAQNCLQAPAE